MKHLRLVLWVAMLSFAVLAGMSSVAQANLILTPGPTPAASFVDLGGTGFGSAPRMLTLQDNTGEFGSVTPVNVVHDGAISGADKSTTPTLATLGWTAGNKVGIGFISDQSGQTGITLDTLVLTIYNGTTAVGSFSLAAPVQFSAADLALQPGNGNAVFNFGLTPAEQTAFNAIPGLSGSFTAGLAASLGCGVTGAPAGCQVSNDGPDTFLGFAQAGQQVVPEPGTLLLLGSGLVGLAAFARRRRS